MRTLSFLTPWSGLDDLVLRGLQYTAVNSTEVIAKVAGSEERGTTVGVLVYLFRVGLRTRIFAHRRRRDLFMVFLGLRQLLGEDEVVQGCAAKLLKNVFLV